MRKVTDYEVDTKLPELWNNIRLSRYDIQRELGIGGTRLTLAVKRLRLHPRSSQSGKNSDRRLDVTDDVRETIKRLWRTQSAIQIGKQLGISEQSVRRIGYGMGLPLRTKPSMIEYTDDVMEFIRNAYTVDGYSAGDIAEELCNRTGANITKNMIVGKLHRMRLLNGDKSRAALVAHTRRKLENLQTAARERKTAPSRKSTVRGVLRDLMETAALIETIPGVTVHVDINAVVSFDALQPGQCRNVFGDIRKGAWVFCGRPKHQDENGEKLSYCKECAVVNYRDVSKTTQPQKFVFASSVDLVSR